MSLRYFRDYSFVFIPELPIECLNTVKIWLDKTFLIGIGADFEPLYRLEEITSFSCKGLLKHSSGEKITQFKIRFVPYGKSILEYRTEIWELVYMLDISDTSFYISSSVYYNSFYDSRSQEKYLLLL